jgi:hypothetical protein
MPGFDNKPSHPWRTPLLILEFSSLALLLGSMAWLSGQAQTGEPLAPGWLLLPALASLGVFGRRSQEPGPPQGRLRVAGRHPAGHLAVRRHQHLAQSEHTVRRFAQCPQWM